MEFSRRDKESPNTSQELNIKCEESNIGINHNKSRALNSKDPINRNIKKIYISGLLIPFSLLLAVVITGWIFYKPIEGRFYLLKYDTSKDIESKVYYAYKTFSTVSSPNTKTIFQKTMKEYIDIDLEKAEEKFAQYKNTLSEDLFKELSIALHDTKAGKLVEKNLPLEAFNELLKIKDLNWDFRGCKNYERVICELLSSKFGIGKYMSFKSLEKEKNIYIMNMDEDNFDEVIQIEEKKSRSLFTELNLKLYKFKDGEYKTVDSTSIQYFKTINSINAYPYEKDKFGIFISGAMAKYNNLTDVYGIGKETLVNLCSVSGFNYSNAVDVDGDGIFEIETHVVDTLANISSYTIDEIPLIRNIYKVNPNDNNATLLTSEKLQSKTSDSDKENLDKSNSYIFVDSNSRYLTDKELSSLSKEQLELARNEIFARHGYVFTMNKFKDYFLKQSWYTPNPNYKGGENSLNSFEKANYRIIQKWEANK